MMPNRTLILEDYFRATGFTVSLESSLDDLEAFTIRLASRIADDMDFWNSIHDADNQADSDWIRRRYGAGSQAGLDG